jgi:hypothetical protein
MHMPGQNEAIPLVLLPVDARVILTISALTKSNILKIAFHRPLASAADSAVNSGLQSL